ncbi:hypothetical protein LJC67_07925, partial [Bacteroidales bacterium OttesenSCG-928-A14]|nr:hypothetical protein [Bacteroidales bacterium OttesenSCG-928-A14]
YSNAGKLVKIEGYKNGTPDGDWKTYSSQTGILLLEEAYRDGVLHGEQKEYYTTGDIKSSTPYINGKRNGMTETYYVGNIPASRGIFHQNVQTGTWEFYDSRGKLRKNVEYVKGLEKTVYLIFYNGSAPQKLNQNIVTFIKKNNNGIDVIVKNGNKIRCTDDFYETSLWLDQLVILQVTPTLMVAYDAIKGYRVVETEEEEWEEEPDELESIISELIEDPLNANANEIVAKETLLLVTDPPYEHDIIVKGRFAAMIKSLCNTAVPVQE